LPPDENSTPSYIFIALHDQFQKRSNLRKRGTYLKFKFFDSGFSSGLSECASCAKWGPHFKFTRFEGAPSLVYALSKIY